MHQPFLQFAALTGETLPFGALQSQNQLAQSSEVWQLTFVAPDGLLVPPLEDPPLDEPPLDDPPLEDDVVSVGS